MELQEGEGGGTHFRELTGAVKISADILLVLIPLTGIAGSLNIPSYLGMSLYLQQYIGFIFGIVIAVTFLLAPPRKKRADDNVPWYDLIFSLTALISGLYIAVNYRDIAVDIGIVTPQRVFLGVAAVMLTIEAARRLVGLIFCVIILLFLFYALFSSYFPGMLAVKSISYGNLATYLYLDPQGILGIPLEVATTIVLIFVLFGQTISNVGVSRLFNDTAFALMGRYRGGPAKVAVLASSLFGMISGSAVANVVTTGVFTIPLMKKAGYKPYFAGAVEAVASTGGQIMPPIMGAAAFLMATFLNMPYKKVAVSAILPALLYYLAVFIQVDLRAAKEGLKGLPPAEIPAVGKVLRENWIFSLPVLVLIYTLFIALMPETTAGLVSILSAVILGLIMTRRTQMNLKKILLILRDCGRGLLEVGVTSAGAGLIIGVLTITGLAFSFSSLLIGLAKGNVFLLLVLSAVVSSILGMGMTVTAAYLLTVVIGAPALIEMGVSPLLAHFFIFYYAVLSFLTPPVCLAAYAAASIAGASMIKTAFQAMKLGVAAYIVPFIFAYKPALLLQGEIFPILEACITAVIGISLVAVGIEAFLFRPLVGWKQGVLIVGGVIMMIPGLTFDLIGLCIVAPVLFLEWRARNREQVVGAESR